MGGSRRRERGKARDFCALAESEDSEENKPSVLMLAARRGLPRQEDKFRDSQFASARA